MEISNITQKRIKEYLLQGKRFDQRGLHDYRELEIETKVSKNAEGSARVKLGKTEVIAGVKLSIEEPFPDSEDEGLLMTGVELLPLSSPEFEPGPPRIDAIELARIVDRGIRESGFIDFKELCITKGEKVWGIYIDIYSINHDGNLIDAAAIAAVVALRTAKMPKLDKDGKIEFGELSAKKLPLGKSLPLTTTFYKIGDKAFIDPTLEEEETSEGRITMTLTNEKEIMINSIQKGGEANMSTEEVFNIIDLAEKKYEELNKKMQKFLNE
jgi:exosome complex component RRP42